MEQQNKGPVELLKDRTICEGSLLALEAILGTVEKYGLEAAKAEVEFERAKFNLVKAHSRLQRLHRSHS